MRPSLLIATLLVALGAAPALAQDPRAARLAAANTFPATELAERQARFVAWLDSAGARVGAEDRMSLWESIYYLIGSAAQAQHQRTGALFPRRDTLGLAALYEHAARLESPGAALVALALRDQAGKAAEPQAMPGGTMRLAFRAPEYTLVSSRGWSIRFPYWMMIATAQTSVPANGLSTETIMLSTLFATDSSPKGRSQATIMINAAAAADSARFVPFWLQALGVRESDRAPGDAKEGTTYRQYDPRYRMHKEIAVRRRGDVLVIFAYLGLPGTFQANREEFEALLASLGDATP